MNTIWWIRRDLRISDNQALSGAIDASVTDGGQVYPVFILDPKLLNSKHASPRRLDFLFGGLLALAADLRQRGSCLTLRRGDSLEELSILMQETGAQAIFTEPDYTFYARRRDERAAHALPLYFSGSPVVFPPGLVVKEDNQPYTMFTPFSKAWRRLPFPGAPLPAPGFIPASECIPTIFIPEYPSQFAQLDSLSARLIPSETEAHVRLAAFIKTKIVDYHEMRNFMDVDGTSILSPYLRFGMISARQVTHAALRAISEAPEADARQSADTWLNELIWREFYVNILYHFPNIRGESFRPEMRTILWENNELNFEAWCDGRTGYPEVDAAMRQLKYTGWMHNRARMIVASFLTKDLLIDWRWGEHWFLQSLIDGDPASNNGGWQWIAGTGTDAAPYFRIFNPITQGRRYDPQGVYIRRWVPELASVPKGYIHEPWKMPLDVQQSARCLIGKDYPFPIVDHQAARERVLAVYGKAKSNFRSL